MFNRGPASLSLIVGLAALLSGGCGGKAKTPVPDAAAADAMEPAPDLAPAPDSATDGAPPADSGADVTVRDDGAVPADVVAQEAAAGGDDAEPGEDDAPPADSGPDLPPIHGPLVAHWPLDEGAGTVAADASGNGGEATLVNSPGWTTSGFPGAQFANAAAVVLDGVDDFVELGARGVPRHEAPKTVSLWFWQDVPATTGRKNIISLTDFDGTGVGTQIGLDAGLASVWFTDDVGGMINSPAPVTAGWHHLAYTYDGAVNRLYLDMQLLGEVTRTAAPAPVEHARLGGFDLVGLEMFAGRVDDVRIYDHALDGAAIAILAGGGTP
jgi:hypothetical protein